MEVQTIKAQRSAATRKTLVKVARRLFARRGYADVSVEEIVRAAGVTKGALYHHFADKGELFEAVAEQLSEEVVVSVMEAARRAKTPEKSLQRGVTALLDAFLDPAVQQILILDGRAVIDPNRWREMNERHSLGLLRIGLEASMEAGSIDKLPVEPLGHMLLGALNDAGCYIANADDVQKARRQAGTTLDRVLSGLEPRR